MTTTANTKYYATSAATICGRVISRSVLRFRSEDSRAKYIAWSERRGYHVEACADADARRMWDEAKASDQSVRWHPNTVLATGKAWGCYFAYNTNH